MSLKNFVLIGITFFAVSVFAQTDENAASAESSPASQEEKPAIVNEDAPADSDEVNEPVPYPQVSAEAAAEKKKSSEENTPKKEEKKEKEKEKKKDTGTKEPPKKYGDCTGDYWIGQRIVTERHAGWGWLKKEGDSWRSAKWIMLQEKPGVVKAPQRFYRRQEDDHNMQYRLYGEFASYKGYEPNIDALDEVFVLKGFEVIGPGVKIDRRPPGPTGTRKGRISEREPF